MLGPGSVHLSRYPELLQLMGFPALSYSLLNPAPLFVCAPPPPSLLAHSLLSALFLLLSRPGSVFRPCSVCHFLSPLWTLPEASGCSQRHIYNKTLPLTIW